MSTDDPRDLHGPTGLRDVTDIRPADPHRSVPVTGPGPGPTRTGVFP